jgi:PAS domain S-box-containing protein
MNADLSDAMSLLDRTIYTPFEDNVPMSVQSNKPQPQSFTPRTVQFFPPGSTATPDQQSTFSPDDSASRSSDVRPPPRETLAPGNPGTAGALTEFTRRRNWPAKVIGELHDLLHILDANGRIKHASLSAERLTGYKPSELRGVFLRDLLHPDDVGLLASELNESIASGIPFRIFYRLRRKDGRYTVFEAVGHAHIAAAKYAPNPTNQTPFCQAVFMMARPYPTRNAALLDSFLEHKMENERLKRKIAELKKDEQDETEEYHRAWSLSQESSHAGMDPPVSPYSRRPSHDTGQPEGMGVGAPSMGPGDTIEMLTGLRYQEGERSRGIIAGNASPALIKGDAGIAIPVDRDGRGGEKKKKIKVAEEYVCTDCGKAPLQHPRAPKLVN